MDSPVITAIHIHPVKSARALSLEEAAVDGFGLALDRRWMVVQPDGRFLTQREAPALATLSARLDGDALTLSAAGREPVAVPPGGSGATREVSVWDDRCVARDEGDAVAAWLTRFLGRDARLVFMPESTVRAVPKFSATHRTAFNDELPLLLAGEASLAALNAQLETPVPMNRFRPNLVVGGAEAWAEERWTELTIGAVRFRGVNCAGRCVVTTTDQATGVRGPEPLRTLARIRTIDGKARFGRHLLPLGRGVVRLGDRVALSPGR